MRIETVVGIYSDVATKYDVQFLLVLWQLYTKQHSCPLKYTGSNRWLSLPRWKIWVRQIGSSSQLIIEENKVHVPNHQPGFFPLSNSSWDGRKAVIPWWFFFHMILRTEARVEKRATCNDSPSWNNLWLWQIMDIYTYNEGLCHYIASQNGNIIGIHWDVMGINMDI